MRLAHLMGWCRHAMPAAPMARSSKPTPPQPPTLNASRAVALLNDHIASALGPPFQKARLPLTSDEHDGWETLAQKLLEGRLE